MKARGLDGVLYEDLHAFLSYHIKNEAPSNPDYFHADIATVFIQFLKDCAGLLVETEGRRLSFVTLTVQEHLTAAHIHGLAELDGVRDVWYKEIAVHCNDPSWRRVIDLLVNSYASAACQNFLAEKIRNCEGMSENR
jgi:hypothetical protein